ncbi:MAG: ComF family protein [Patescibacteria group bacterium]|mgnify:CR=1 FL=1
MISLLVKTKNAVFDILFPPICLNCQKYLNQPVSPEIQRDKPNNFLCDDCYLSIQLNSSLFCPVCKLRLAENKKICGHSKYLLAAAGNYNDQIFRNIIHYFKYESFENLTSILAEIIFKYLDFLMENGKFKIGKSKFGIKNFIVVPIPLHYRRERQRGFNQSKLLADEISKKFNIQVVECLKRIKNNDPQAKLKSNNEREKNISGCFKIINPEMIKNKNILLVDDVFTSGATINEAVKILKENSARRIIAIVVAKA